MKSGVPEEDYAVWLSAPRERTRPYFSTYAAVSREVQAALRAWVRDEFYAQPSLLARPQMAQSILVYISTLPFRGKPTNTFSYDVQSNMLETALSSAARGLRGELVQLTTDHLERRQRKIYDPDRSGVMIQYVRVHHRTFAKMLSVDTGIINRLLRFAVVDIPRHGLGNAVADVRTNIETLLNRLSSELALGSRADMLLAIATAELRKQLSTAAEQSV